VPVRPRRTVTATPGPLSDLYDSQTDICGAALHVTDSSLNRTFVWVAPHFSVVFSRKLLCGTWFGGYNYGMTNTGTRTASDIITADTIRRAADPDRDDLLTCTDTTYVVAIMVFVTYVNQFPMTIVHGGNITPVALATQISDGVSTGWTRANALLDAAMMVRAGFLFVDAEHGDDDRDEMVNDIATVAAYMA
jgi:hypothetical protein